MFNEGFMEWMDRESGAGALHSKGVVSECKCEDCGAIVKAAVNRHTPYSESERKQNIARIKW